MAYGKISHSSNALLFFFKWHKIRMAYGLAGDPGDPPFIRGGGTARKMSGGRVAGLRPIDRAKVIISA